jgi:hypothetical protein
MAFTLAPGDSPLSGYTIERGLGAGGFGEVYFAVSDSGKEVALKRIHRNLEIELRGARQCLNLRHPNLVSLIDIRQPSEEQAWIVMEYIHGESLKEILDRSPLGLASDEALRYFGQIGAGVQYLHDRGIVHRDLKPANIFIENGWIKIGDYGLSKFISASRRGGQTQSVGTFHYMAPEIGRGEYGKEVDVYALGVILFEMLTGQVPFDGETTQEIIMKHLTSDPDLSRLPASFQASVGRALSKDPRDRYESVQAMLAALGITLDAAGLAKTSNAAPSATAPSPLAVPADSPPPYYREPIANAFAVQIARLQRALERIPYGSPLFLLVLLALIAVLTYFRFLAPYLLYFGFGYAVYYLLWYVGGGYTRPAAAPVRRHRPPASPGGAVSRARQLSTAATVQVPPDRLPPVDRPPRLVIEDCPRPLAFPQWQIQQRRRLADRSWPSRWREWSRSNLIAALVLSAVSIAGYLVVLAGDAAFGNSLEFLAVGTWAGSMTLLASWMILFLTKFWEGATEDSIMYRLVLFSGGLALGAIGWWLSEFLMIPWNDLPTAARFNKLPAPRLWSEFYKEASPPWPAFVAYFGLLLGSVRWWRQADVLRRHRFSLLSVLWSTLVATLISAFVYFPTPWCLIVAAGTSLLIQLSTQRLRPLVNLPTHLT